jgi:hypothetical protein
MSRRDANQYNILNTVNTGLADRLDPQSLQESSNELQKQLFDKLELSNFLEPFTLKVATDSIKGSKNGLGAVWAHMYDAVKNKNIMGSADVYRAVSRNLPSGVVEGALSDLQSGGPSEALAGAFRRTVEAAQRGEVPAVENALGLLSPEAKEGIRAGRAATTQYLSGSTSDAIKRMASGGGDGRESLFSKSASQLHSELAARDPEAAARLQESLDNATASAAARVEGAVESPLGTASTEATNASQSAVGNVTRLLGGVERSAKINPALLPELPEDAGSGGLQQSVFDRSGDSSSFSDAADRMIREARLAEGFGAEEAGGATKRTAAELENFKDSIADTGRPESWASTAYRKVKKLGRIFDRRIGKEFGAVQPLQVREGQLIVNPADSVLGESLGPRPLAPIGDDPEVPDLVGMADEGGGSAVFNPSQIIKNLNLLGRAPSAEREVPTELETMIPEKRARFLRPTEAPERIQPLTAAPQAELIQQPDRLSELRTAGGVDRSGALERIERGVAARRASGRSVTIETKPFGDVKRDYRRTRGRSTTVKPLRRTETDFPEAPAAEAPAPRAPIRTAEQADALFADDDEEDTSIAPVPKPRALKEDTSGLWDKDDDEGIKEPDSTFDLEGFQRNEANRIANAKSALDRDFPENMFDEDDEEEEAAPAAAAEQAEPRGITDDDIFDMNFDGESKVGEVDAPNVVRGGGSAQDTQTITRIAPEDTTGYAETGAADDIEAATGAAADTAAQRADTGSTLLSDLKDPVASSGAATTDEVIEGAATGFLTEQAAGGLEGIDAIPVIGDIAGVVAGLGGALAVEFMNRPEASPVEHIKSVVNVASQFGASQ